MSDKKLQDTAKLITRGFGEWWKYPDKIEKAVLILLDKGLTTEEIENLLDLIISDIRSEYGD